MEDESRRSVIQHEHTGLEVVHFFTCKICFDSLITYLESGKDAQVVNVRLQE